jgi:aspartate ammonia-lyase
MKRTYLSPVATDATAKYESHPARLAGKPTVTASDMIAAQWDQQGFVRCSSALTSLAAPLSKSESAPSCDFEITLPQSAQLDDCAQNEFDSARVDANRCLLTEGDDSIVCLAAQSGKLLLNPYEPLEVLYE